MLSYQHAYHAGNAADVHKHTALAALLRLLTNKIRPVSYMESHAGRGLYDLSSAEAAKTGEAGQGICRLVRGSGPYWEALDRVRAEHGTLAYPGSPALARALLRSTDRLVLCELHPAEHRALKAVIPEAEIHRRDGHEALPALTPPTPRRGLSLIDPSYEVKTEYLQTAETALMVLRRWPQGIIMVWYPMLPEARHLELTAKLRGAGPACLIDEVTFADPPSRGMIGSGLAVLNPPYRAGAAIGAARDGTGTLFTHQR